MNFPHRPRQPRSFLLASSVAALLALSVLAPVQAQQDSISLQSQPVAAALPALAKRTGAVAAHRNY